MNKMTAKSQGVEELTGRELAERCVGICQTHKAEDIELFDVTGLSMITDYYLLCTGTSEPHLRALRGYFHKELGEDGLLPDHVDGDPASGWIVMDYGGILIHIFTAALREFYKLDEIFARKAEDAAQSGE